MSLIKDADGGIRVISMSDLILHPLFGELKDSTMTIPTKKKDVKLSGIEAMLWTMGLDIFLPYESEVINHRSDLTGTVQCCERFVGSKRQDDVWKKLEYKMNYVGI